MFHLLRVLSIIALATLSMGGIAYFLLALFAVLRLRVRSRAAALVECNCPPLSLLKPLCGLEPDLENNLRSFFEQDYPEYEILFAAREEADPALPLARKLIKDFPGIASRILVTGDSPYANAKVYSMEKLAETARFDLLIVTDSDVSADPNYLKSMARAFDRGNTGAVTSLYRGVGGADLWSKLEAFGMSTEFMAGVVVAEFLEGMKFTIGPSMGITRRCLEQIGGFPALAEYLADDFVLGEKAAAAGYEVALSAHAVDHHAYSTGFVRSFQHRLRWNRSSRFSRPTGYWGQGFTYALPWALLFFLCFPTLWTLTLLSVSLLLRIGLAYLLGSKLLGDRTVTRRMFLIPLQDLLSFATWLGGLFGREISWRNQRYQLLPGGRFKPMPKTEKPLE